MHRRPRSCYLVRRVIDIAQGNVAKLIDAAAVQLLWRVARGRATGQERQVAGLFPSLLHIPAHVHLPIQQAGRVNSVVGTWSRDSLVDYLAAGPGGLRTSAPAGGVGWLAAVGTEASFPAALPAMTWLTREPGRPYAFVPAEREIFEADDSFLARTAAWYRREGLRAGIDDREREGALSAARIAELWLDSSRAGALEGLAAFELELRLRRMGMAAGDGFAQRFGWAHRLIGVDAMRAFNRHLAPWVAATLMPEPFRLGLVDRGVAHAGLCAVLLAAGASAANLARAAAESATAPRSLPISGVKYVGPAGGDPSRELPVHRLLRGAHGIPVFAPLAGHPEGLWEMFVAVRIDRIMRPDIFRQPSPLALRREMGSLDAIIVRVGPQIVPDSPSGAAEGGHLEAILLSDSCTVDEVNRQVAVAGGAAARALRAFWRMSR